MSEITVVGKLKRAAIWTSVQSALMACVIYGAGYDHAWALNIYKFIAWVLTVVYVILFLGKVTGQKPSVGPRSVPMWIAAVTDFAIAIVLAALGHWFYASLQVAQQFLEQYVFMTETPDQKG